MFRRLVPASQLPGLLETGQCHPYSKGPPSSSDANYRPISINLYCLRCLSAWCRFVLDDLWNAVVSFQPPSLLIGKVWVPVMHFCACRIHCKVHWRVASRLGSSRLISAQPLMGATIMVFCISSVLWVFEVLCCLCAAADYTRRCDRTSVHLCASSLQNLAISPDLYSLVSISVERS